MLRQRALSTYFYLLVFLGLLSYLILIDPKIKGTKETEENSTRLFDLAQVEPNGVEITNKYGNFIFQKKNDHWEIKQPVVAMADGGQIEEVINQVRFASVQRNIPVDSSSSEGEANLKSWGLLPAETRIILHAPNNKNYELMIGRNVAITDSIYARVAAKKTEPVKIVSNTLKNAVEKELSAFRSRTIFDFNTDDVTTLSSQVTGMDMTTFQSCEVDKKDGQWMLQKPLVARAADADVKSLLDRILALRVTDFITDDSSHLIEYGLNAPRASFGIKLKSGEEVVLQIGLPVPKDANLVYAQRLKSTSVITLPKSSVEDLLKSLPNVRDRHIFRFTPATATSLTYTFKDKKAAFTKQKGVWTIAHDEQALLDVSKINTLLTKLSELQTTPAIKDSPADLKTYGLDKPVGKISVELSNPKAPTVQELSLGKEENKLIYAKNSTEPYVYTLDTGALDFLAQDPNTLRDNRVLNLDLKKIRGVTYTTADGKSVVLHRSEGGTWSVANLKDVMPDTMRAETQASLLSQLQAKSWLGPVLPTYGLNKPVLKITIHLQNADPVVLKVGATLPDSTHAAQVEGQDAAFALQDGDYGILNASMLQAIPLQLKATNNAPVPPSTNVVNKPGK